MKLLKAALTLYLILMAVAANDDPWMWLLMRVGELWERKGGTW